MIYTNATFSSKWDAFEPKACAVKKVIRLSAEEYDRFADNMLRDQDFIKDNRDLMRYDNGTQGCLLVIGEGRRDGILIDSSGHDYARYAAFIPNAGALLTVGQYPALAWLNEKLTEIAEYISAQDGNSISIDIREMDFMFGIDMARNPALVSTVMEMLGDIPDIGQMMLDKNKLTINRKAVQPEDLSDPSVSRTDMYAYGYIYEGMIPLGRERALELYDKGHEVFLLYEDETEGMAENRGEIEVFDGMFGVEGSPKENEILPPDFGVFILNQESVDKDGARGEWLPLPTTAGALRELFGRIGVSRPSESAYTITAVRTPLSDLLGDRITKYDCLDELNMLASYMADMKDYEITKLQAILSSGVADISRGTSSLINALSAENFNAFNWIDARDAEALGRYYHAENDEKPDGVSFKEHGEHCAEEENGAFTEWGYICFSYKELLPEYAGEVPEEYKITGKALRGLRRQPADRPPEEKPSVLKRIRESREAPKLPGREKTPDPRKHRNGEEL